MKIAPFSEVTCTILHDTAEPPSMDMLLDAVVHFAPTCGLRVLQNGFPEKEKHSASIWVGLDEERLLNVEIKHIPQPIQAEAFQTAFDVPMNLHFVPDAKNIIRRHSSATLIIVSMGPLPVSPETERIKEFFGDALDPMLKFRTYEEALKAKMLCRALAHVVVAHHSSTLLYWLPHNKLLLPEALQELNGTTGILLMDMNPLIFSNDSGLSDDAPIGCVLINSHYLVGKIIKFEPAPVTVRWMMDKLLKFVLYCLDRDELIGDGETFRDDDGEWVIQVRHVPPEKPELPGEVHLKVLYSKEHGIDVRKEAWTGGAVGTETVSARPESLTQPSSEQPGVQPMTGQPGAQPMMEPPMPSMGATSHDDARQQRGMGLGNAGAESAPVFGNRAAPLADQSPESLDRAALFGTMAKQEERARRNWIQALAARLGISEALARVFVVFFVIFFLMKGVVPFLFG